MGKICQIYKLVEKGRKKLTLTLTFWLYPQICCLILSRWESCSAWPVTAWMRGSRSRGTERRESWNPPLVELEVWGAEVTSGCVKYVGGVTLLPSPSSLLLPPPPQDVGPPRQTGAGRLGSLLYISKGEKMGWKGRK